MAITDYMSKSTLAGATLMAGSLFFCPKEELPSNPSERQISKSTKLETSLALSPNPLNHSPQYYVFSTTFTIGIVTILCGYAFASKTRE